MSTATGSRTYSAPQGPSTGRGPKATSSTSSARATPSARLLVYHNERGKGFTEVADSVGLGSQSPEAVTLSDLNGDKWPDVIEVLPDELRVLLNNKSGKFSSAFSTPLKYGSSVAAGDVNGDDRPDIYVYFILDMEPWFCSAASIQSHALYVTTR